MVQEPVPLSIVTVALVIPPATLDVPMAQTDVLAEFSDSVTVNPDVDCAATGNVLTKIALAGAEVVNETDWASVDVCTWASSKAPISQAEPWGRITPR